ncbi:hypothetical protein ACFXHK_25910, partial [Embleya sp. NPDC059267]
RPAQGALLGDDEIADLLRSTPPTVRGRAHRVRGRHRYRWVVLVKCPRCMDTHQHHGVGVRRAPCGLLYLVRVRIGGRR